MSIRVRYISLVQEAGKRTAEEDGMEKQLVSLAAEARREIAENAGFLKLIYEKTGEVFFYNSKICGIIGDLSRLSSLGLEVQTASVAKEIIKNGLTKSILKIAHMPARALGMEDYRKLFLLGDYEKLWRKRKWLDIQSVNVMTADLAGRFFCFPFFIVMTMDGKLHLMQQPMTLSFSLCAEACFLRQPLKWIQGRRIPLCIMWKQPMAAKEEGRAQL